jgi:hypothetical protein
MFAIFYAQMARRVINPWSDEISSGDTFLLRHGRVTLRQHLASGSSIIMSRLSKLFLNLVGWACVLSACGGSSLASIEGTVSGLGTSESVVLQNNGSDTITVTGSQAFVFPTGLATGAAYSVTVVTPPAGKTCTVSNGSGTVDSNGDAVTNVLVSCVATASVGGTVTGLGSGLSLVLLNTYDSGAQSLIVSANGAFVFPGLVPLPGNSFAVTVLTQPTGQTCTVNGGTVATGTATSNVMVSVTVACQ